MPRNGFLIVILGLIFMKGNCASEESVWEFLNTVGVYDGDDHPIYREPGTFLTRALVQQKYLAYQQVPTSHPPSFEFLWGPKAHAEMTKMKGLEFLARINECDPLSFLFLYEEALRDEEERACAQSISPNRSSFTLMAEHAFPACTQTERIVFLMYALWLCKEQPKF